MSEAGPFDSGLPSVGEDRGNRGLWLGLGAIGLAGLLLFTALEGNRAASIQPQISSPTDYAVAANPQPELILPQPPVPDASRLIFAGERALRANGLQDGGFKLPPVRLTRAGSSDNGNLSLSPANSSSFAPPAFVPPAVAERLTPDPGRSAPVIVYDAAQTETVQGAAPAPAKATKVAAVGGGDRTHLVPQGTLISAVLETAIDSTQSGQVRAMVSKDVYNALGDSVLVPKGSRIFGEYKGELSAGQNRAQIIWTRLIRPDGATIALDSPASDPLGRAGVKGRVDSHFGQRLLNALLQSTINFGTFAASRAVTNNNGVILALPTDAQNASSQILPEVPRPTLRVRHGTLISVFVARDLDFTAVE